MQLFFGLFFFLYRYVSMQVMFFLPLTVRFSMPHSNMIQPHFSRDVAERLRSPPAIWASVSSTIEYSSISSRPNSTLDFSKGIAVMAHVPMSTKAEETTQLLENMTLLWSSLLHILTIKCLWRTKEIWKWQKSKGLSILPRTVGQMRALLQTVLGQVV